MAADMEISQTVRLGYPFLVVSLVTVDCNEDFHAIELVHFHNLHQSTVVFQVDHCDQFKKCR